MRVLVLVLLLFLAGLWVHELIKGANPEARRRTIYWTVSMVLVAILLLVVVRFGVHWLAVVAAGAFALLRSLFPWLLRLLPFAARAFQSHRSRKTGERDAPAPAPPGAMSRSEALEILGLEEGATREQILAAYKSLIKKVHPDVPGGSTRLAQQVNRAKNVLLGE